MATIQEDLKIYQQNLIARHNNNNFSNETKTEISKIIDEIGEMINPKIYWEKGIEIDVVSVHDKVHVIYGVDQFGNEYEATGQYSCEELVSVEDITKV